MLDLKRLQFFVAVCDRRSLTRAAGLCHVTQPVLSYHMAELEKSVGETLLHRRTDGVEPTEAGKILLEHARRIVAAAQAAELAMRDRRSQPSGLVCIGLLASIAPTLAPRLIRACHARYPGIVLRIAEGTSLLLRAGIEDESFDLAVNLRERGDHTRAALLVEDLHFVTGRGLLDIRKETVTLAEALQHALLLPPRGHVVRALVEDAAKSQGLEVRVQAEVEGMATLKSLVAQSIGATILGYGAIKEDYESGALIVARLTRPAIQRAFILDEAVRRKQTKAVEAIREIIIREMQELSH